MLKKLDFISPEITLFYRGRESHSSILSGILSIIVFLGILGITIYLSIDVIAKQHPTSFYFTKFIEEIDSYPLNSSAILHYVSLYNSNNREIGIDTKAIYVIGVSINDNVFTEDNDISKYSHWIYEYCDESDLGDFKETYTDAQKDNLTNSLCISKYFDVDKNIIINKDDNDFIYPTLVHGASQSNNFEYGIYFQRCQNHTLINNNNCYTKSQQDVYIKGITGYEIYFIDHSIDVEKYHHPIDYAIHRITSELNKDSYVLNHLNFHPVVVRTNDGLFFDNLKNTISFNFDYNEKITHANDDYKILGSFNFWMQNTIDTYDRAYKKVQDIAGGVDGIVEIVMIIAKLLNSFFFHNYQTIVDFHFELEKDDIRNKPNVKVNNSNFNGSKISYKKDFNGNINSQNGNNGFEQQVLSVSRNVSRKILVKKKNFYITNSDVNNSDNLSRYLNFPNKNKKKKKKKFNWFSYCCNEIKIKKNEFVEALKEKRESVLSEEKLIQSIFDLKRIQEKMKKDFINPQYDYEKLETKDVDNNPNNSINTIPPTPSPLILNK